MNPLNRREKILELLKKDGQVAVKELSVLFDTSEVTLRSDLKFLENQGKLKRFFGGAQSIESLPLTQQEYEDEVQIDNRYQLNSDSKERIACVAAGLVRKGDSIIIDSGSTTHLVAKCLAKEGGYTIITNNLAASSELLEAPDTTLVIVGGTYRSKTKSLHGYQAEQCLNGVQADVLFVGADGIDPEKGITTFNEGYAITGVMASCVQKVVAVVDSAKLGRIGFNKVLDASQIDTLVTDSGIPADTKRKFENIGLEVIVVD
ncbi:MULTISPECIES: DeoR/GlpR family DNA-binding transcription regulator [Vibrio]|jgi:DeoR family galactitol utilization operon repressor|uniref:DeoR/GlpR family DNA-binding transcription regulator n=1 Tax=Vibrio barjaei TaxID=1676683 RepID=A0ABW7IPZ1_9VIBR|nr:MULTISPECIES: DeoR/GlpR family DNA-binding transcription regulator [Vibrio]EDL54909.1 transcriptional regulator of sugar metabolism [Vibrio mediterranei AK1]KFA95432.1 galactitol utilization operon repressor [Vibrio sp. ER1A]MCG9789658.1 DeoR/GlpR family DNA-binding transcription regulator [Vibrio mediterranei]NOH28077.1 DeoR/GlpR transcriptional regulator [Vibrio mediterranei]OIN26275.1 transcriptional regulator [Vibrio barjaei]